MFARFFAALLAAQFFWSGAVFAGDAPDLDTVLAATGGNGAARHFYQLHAGLAWHGSKDAEADAHLARETLANAATEGLDPGRYRASRDSDNVVADDVGLSIALLTYMRDLAIGRPELKSLDADVALPTPSFDAAQMLDQALRQRRLAAMLASLEPASSEYAALKSELARDPGGAEVPVILANMERWRWLPRTLEADRIVINAADASLQLWLGGQPVLSSKVIVGKPRTPTPILRAEGAGLTFNPAWTVPHSIAVKEILPKLKRNRSYLASQEMILLNGPPGDPHGLAINWRAIPAGTFPYTIRQVPGPRNPLGQIKLELPNRFDVYLHDTPGQAAFARPNRALSHGCVRVEQILPLASYALNADLGAQDQITQAIGEGETQYVPLQKKLPVYFLYWTAFPDAQGKIQFRRDLYGRDQRLIAAMHASNPRIAGDMPACLRG